MDRGGIPLRGFLRSYSEEVHAQRADETAVVIVDCQIGPRPVGGGRAKKKTLVCLFGCWRPQRWDGAGSHQKVMGENMGLDSGWNSHTHLGVVDQVLQRVVAGEQVHHLLVVGDGAGAGVLGTHHPRDGDVLNSGEVCKHSGPLLLCDLRGELG